MARNETPPEDIKDFLRSPEDLARVLDWRGREQQVRETLEKASQNPNFASAMQALHALPAEEPPKAVQPSERAEYNPAKTIPPRTRRDTLELQPKLVVRDDVLDSRHRPTAKIQRVAVDALLPVVPSESTAVPVIESPREEESETRERPIVGTYSTLEGLGHLGAQGGGAREVVRVERKGVDTAALGAMKTEEISAATAKTEPVAVFPDESASPKRSAQTSPTAEHIDRTDGASAPPAPNTEPEQVPEIVAGRRPSRGWLLLLAAAAAVIAIGAIVLWSSQAQPPTYGATPPARAPTPSATGDAPRPVPSEAATLATPRSTEEPLPSAEASAVVGVPTAAMSAGAREPTTIGSSGRRSGPPVGVKPVVAPSVQSTAVAPKPTSDRPVD